MESESDFFSLNIKTLDSKVHSIKNIADDLKVSELKEKIASELGVPSEEQRLIFQGKVLKDEKHLKFYSLKNGCTIHLIKKKNQRHYNAAQQPQTTTEGATTGQGQSTQTNASFGTPNIVVGSISIPDGGNSSELDINRLLGNVFNSLGVAPGSSSSFDQNYFQQQQQRFTNLESNIAQISHPTVNNQDWTPPQPNTSNNIEILGSYLSRIQSDYSIISAAITHLASLLQQESSLENAEQRQEVERLAHQLGPAFQYLGALLITISATLSSLQMGSAPNSAQADFSPRPIFTRSIQTEISTNQSGAQTSNTQQQGQPMRVSVPLFTVSQRGTGQQSNQQDSETSSPQPTTNQANQPIQPPQQSPQSQNSQQRQNPMENMSGLFSMVNSLLGQISQQNLGAQSNTNNSSQPSNFQQPNPTQQTMQPQNTQRTNPALLSQTFNAVSEAISASNPSSMSSVIGSIAQGMNTSGGEKEETVLGDILQKVLDLLTVPDMLAIMSGNWESLQRIHPTLRDYLRELCKGEITPSSLEKVTEEIIASIKEHLHESNLPDDIKRRIKPGYEITSLSLHVIRKHTLKLLQVINSDFRPTPSNSHPFALAIKNWTAKFVEELVRLLSQSLQGGVADAAHVIRFFLQERLSFMGPEFSQMGTNMVTSYIMETYSNIKNTINEKDPNTWTSMIEVDEIRQTQTSPQRPFSDIYLSGTSSKRRKVSHMTTASLVNTRQTGKIASADQVLQERIREALKNAKISEAKTEEIIKKCVEKGLDSKYTDELIRDIGARLNSDSDFLSDPSKYPSLSSIEKK